MKSNPAIESKQYPVSLLQSMIAKQLITPDMARYDEKFLLKALQNRLLETQCKIPGDYLMQIEKDTDEIKLLLNSLINSYTEFFRSTLTFAVLEQIILPELVLKMKSTKKNEIRIWSAACASGQESYSLAMLLEEYQTGINEKISYRIFSTDQSEAQVNTAIKGQYTAEALNNVSLKRTKQWFNKQGNVYTVKPELKSHIEFSVFDLFSKELSCPPASIFGDFDLVVCANLLFYYKNENRQAILEKTGNCIAPGGYLITGETERQILIDHNYTEAFPQSAIFRKK